MTLRGTPEKIKAVSIGKTDVQHKKVAVRGEFLCAKERGCMEGFKTFFCKGKQKRIGNGRFVFYY